MFTQLVVTLTLALFCAASPIVVRDNLVKLPVARRFNSTGTTKLVELDRIRAKSLKNRTKIPHTKQAFRSAAQAALANDPVTNTAVTYTAEVQVGSPATTFTLIVDTGSSNTWVGATTPFEPTSTTVDTGEIMFVEYGSGFVLGEEVLDQVSFGGITIPQQSIGTALLDSGFDGVDGILAIGPTDLTDGSTSDGNPVPTVTDNAAQLGLISTRQVGVSFEPTTSLSVTNGELTFGGADSSKFTGSLHTVPITSTSPANEFFGVDQSVSYGSTTILAETAGIVDTGTTLTLLATDALEAYQAATGAVQDENTGLLMLTPAQFANLKNLDFNIGGQTFSLTPNAQIWPRALNTAIGGTTDGIYLIVSDLGTPSGEGLDFINGFTFLERFYTVFDSSANTVSFATTPFTTATTN